MRWLMRAIGRVLGITQPAGLAPQTQDSPIGGDNSTAEPQRQLAPQGSKRGQRTAKQIISAPSPKAETLPAPTRTKKSSTSGTSQVTPAHPPVSPKLKRKLKAVHKTTVDKLSKQIQKAAQVEHGQGGSQAATPASPILLHAKPAVRAKQARALRITQEALQALERVPALTRTEVQSGERGKRKVTASPSSQQKPARKAAKSTTAGKSRSKEPSQQDKQARGQQSVTPAPKTRQPAPQAKTRKQKAAVSTTPAKKGTQGKTHVQTRTVRSSKARGS